MAIGNSFSCSFRGVVSGEIGGSLYNSNSMNRTVFVILLHDHEHYLIVETPLKK